MQGDVGVLETKGGVLVQGKRTLFAAVGYFQPLWPFFFTIVWALFGHS